MEHQNGFANSIPLFDEMPRSLTNDSLDTPAGLTISEIKPRVISLRVQRLTEVTLPVRVCRCLTGGAGGASVDPHGLTPVALAEEVCIYLEGCMPSNSL